MKGLLPSVAEAIRIDERQLESLDHDPLATPGNWHFVNSGTAALALAILDAKAKKPVSAKPQVVLPAYCCPDIVSAVLFAGAEPVLVDLDPDSPQMKLQQVTAAVTDATVAIVAVNVLGISERLAELAVVARENHCALIDDSCQSMPRTFDRPLDVDYRVLSFGRGKPVSLLHGGALLAAKPLAPEVLQSIETPATLPGLAAVYRLRASVFNGVRQPLVFSLISKLGLAGKTSFKPLSEISDMLDYPRRILPAAIVRHRLSEAHPQRQLAHKLGNLSERVVDLPMAFVSHAGDRLLRYPLLASTAAIRNHLIHRCRESGVYASSMYGQPLPDIAGTGFAMPSENFPNAVEFSQKLLTIPLHTGISRTIIDTIAAILESESATP